MAHVDLSLSEVFAPAAGTPTEQESDNFEQWSSTVSHAAEPCLLIDADTTVVAISSSGCELLCLGAPEDVIGRPLLDGGLRLVDFTANSSELTEQETDKIPPLLALHSGRLARGLLRVQEPGTDAPGTTVDAISTPVLADDSVAGSLTFFSVV
ncbi:PAS domain-containing protein [Micromonospora sp. RTP1Z1]|uniref:PAS domain-containing protein n=1 Tax=Micromonospora sp. RTP1Z1 TaxID=2994043 RepID=UPI0029C7D85B|nr:PAS domain-containing protein [Micromonospora sp. RTP1Z1]